MKKTKEQLQKDLDELENELSFWKSYQPVNNMGKWSTSVRMESIRNKIEKLKKRINKIKENLMQTFVIVKKTPMVEICTFRVEAKSESDALLMVVNKQIDTQDIIIHDTQDGPNYYIVDHEDEVHDIGGSD